MSIDSENIGGQEEYIVFSIVKGGIFFFIMHSQYLYNTWYVMCA